MKRECGEGYPNSAAAPATVSGEPIPIRHWSQALGRRNRPRPASQETGQGLVNPNTVGGTVGGIMSGLLSRAFAAAHIRSALLGSCVIGSVFTTLPFGILAQADTLPPIQVTADRLEELETNTGSSITVLRADAIQRSGAKGIADILRGTAGVEVREAGGVGTNSAVSIRGSNPGQTLVLIDGIRMGDPSVIDGAVDFGNLVATDIERIEVLRGPQSALYGSEAMGGVINIITKRGAGPMRRSVMLEGGSYGTIHTRASVSGGTDQINYAFGIDGIHTDGFPRYGYRIQRPLTIGFGSAPLPPLPWGDPTNKGGVSARVSYRLSDSVSLETGLFGFDNAIRFDNSNAMIASNVFNARNHSSATLLQSYARLISDNLDGRLHNQMTVFGTITDRNNWVTESCYDLNYNAFDCRYGYRGTRQGAEYQGDLKLGANGIATLGLRNETERASTSQSPAPAGTFTPIKAEQTTNSAFAQYRFSSNDKLDLTFGGRVDGIVNGPNFATWRVTGSYRFDETNSRLHASLGTGAKSASLYQRFSEYGFASLQAEQNTGGDIGIEQKLFNDRLRMDVTAFNNRYHNLIGFGRVASCIASQIYGCYYNVGRALTQGVEVSGEAILVPESWKLQISYTSLKAQNLITNSQLLQRPNQQASAALIYTGLPNLEAQARVTFVGKRLDYLYPASVTLAPYAKWDLLGTYKIDQRISVFARVENLTNARYEEVYNYGVAGRTLMAGMKVTW